jgi:tripeptide aminopeptidase
LAFNFDGGEPEKLTIGATGGCRLGIEVQGLASHAGGAPERGVSAIAIAALAIARLQREGWHGQIHQRGRDGTSNVGVIEGGTATNVVADRVTLRAEARSHDPQFRAEIVRRIEEAFREAAAEVRSVDGRSGQVRIEARLDYESFLLEPGAECVRLAEAAVRAVGREPLRTVSNGGLDANWITRHGVPAVTLGCGQRNQHTVSEALELGDFREACRIAWLLASGAVD